ncbi:MAG: glutathione transferase GstA [Neomegalonema sp.]|nr:glutathione transferase GstA [Neomegalonema sp.]
MKLYMKPGACSLASHIALYETGAAFEIEKVDTDEGRTETGADYSAISPNGYVPALALSDDDIITEGPAVLQYIADQHPQAELAPASGTRARTQLHQYLNFLSSELHKSFSPFFSGATLAEDERAAVVAKISKRLDYLESQLADGRAYLVGDKFSVADAHAFVVAGWAVPTGVGLDRWPSLKAFIARISERPAVQKALKAEGLA